MSRTAQRDPSSQTCSGRPRAVVTWMSSAVPPCHVDLNWLGLPEGDLAQPRRVSARRQRQAPKEGVLCKVPTRDGGRFSNSRLSAPRRLHGSQQPRRCADAAAGANNCQVGIRTFSQAPTPQTILVQLAITFKMPGGFSPKFGPVRDMRRIFGIHGRFIAAIGSK